MPAYNRAQRMMQALYALDVASTDLQFMAVATKPAEVVLRWAGC